MLSSALGKITVVFKYVLDEMGIVESVSKVPLSQPSVETDSFSAAGLGCPKAAHKARAIPQASPAREPYKCVDFKS